MLKKIDDILPSCIEKYYMWDDETNTIESMTIDENGDVTIITKGREENDTFKSQNNGGNENGKSIESTSI